MTQRKKVVQECERLDEDLLFGPFCKACLNEGSWPGPLAAEITVHIAPLGKGPVLEVDGLVCEDHLRTELEKAKSTDRMVTKEAIENER